MVIAWDWEVNFDVVQPNVIYLLVNPEEVQLIH